MQSSYFKYNKTIFLTNLKIYQKVDLFNTCVVTNGLFGCQVWNATTKHIDELEAMHFKLLRQMMGWNKLEWGRGPIMKYAEDAHLNLMPIEWRIIKLQLRYMGHEVRVEPNRVTNMPHNMLFRGHVSGFARLDGGMDRAYPAAMREVLRKCGLHITKWVDLARNKKVWKKIVEEDAKKKFMEGWYVREEKRRVQRRKHLGLVDGSLRIGEGVELIDDDLMADGREEPPQEEVGLESDVESEELVDELSEGEEEEEEEENDPRLSIHRVVSEMVLQNKNSEFGMLEWVNQQIVDVQVTNDAIDGIRQLENGVEDNRVGSEREKQGDSRQKKLNRKKKAWKIRKRRRAEGVNKSSKKGMHILGYSLI
jgi:hypothetical protein